jgi:predicted SnoaL-like aldol condensation-catalyzing enzyme
MVFSDLIRSTPAILLQLDSWIVLFFLRTGPVLFQRRVKKTFCNYIQHSALHIEPGRGGLFKLIKNLPSTLRYESGTIVAEGDFVIVHGRFSDFGAPVNWIAADVVRLKDGLLVEHWDVIQDEVTEEQSQSKAPMFETSVPKGR